MAILRRAVDEDLLSLLEDAGENAVRCTELLRELLAEYPQRAELASDVSRCEKEGDRITHDLLCLLERGRRASMPFGPRDGHVLVCAIDDIVDYAEQAADALGVYSIEAPMEQAEAMADVLVAATEHTAAALRSFRDRTSWSAHLVEIRHFENEGDRLLREALRSLFAHGIDPMVVIRWKDIFDSLEHAVDSCESVANLLEGISLKRGLGR